MTQVRFKGSATFRSQSQPGYPGPPSSFLFVQVYDTTSPMTCQFRNIGVVIVFGACLVRNGWV